MCVLLFTEYFGEDGTGGGWSIGTRWRVRWLLLLLVIVYYLSAMGGLLSSWTWGLARTNDVENTQTTMKVHRLFWDRFFFEKKINGLLMKKKVNFGFQKENLGRTNFHRIGIHLVFPFSPSFVSGLNIGWWTLWPGLVCFEPGYPWIVWRWVIGLIASIVFCMFGP